jgi:hypothetical protein
MKRRYVMPESHIASVFGDSTLKTDDMSVHIVGERSGGVGRKDLLGGGIRLKCGKNGVVRCLTYIDVGLSVGLR